MHTIGGGRLFAKIDKKMMLTACKAKNSHRIVSRLGKWVPSKIGLLMKRYVFAILSYAIFVCD